MSQITKELLEQLGKCKCEGVEFWEIDLEEGGHSSLTMTVSNSAPASLHTDERIWRANIVFIELLTQELLKKGCYKAWRDGKGTQVVYCPPDFGNDTCTITEIARESDHPLAIIKAFIEVFGEKE